MRRGPIFWGTILILAGIVFLLDTLGLLGNIQAWNLFWPLALIAFGVWTLFGSRFRRVPEIEHASIPLDGASRARVRLNHGAGRLSLNSGASADQLIEGDFGGGLDLDKQHRGDELDIRMSVPVQFLPFSWGPGYSLDWDLRVNPEVELDLHLEAGAGETRLDLNDLLVRNLQLKTGASRTEVVLPGNAGHTRVDISAGAAQVNVVVPQGVGARIRTRGGISDIQVDQARFPRVGDYYQSQDYSEASNRVDLDVEMGVGSVRIR